MATDLAESFRAGLSPHLTARCGARCRTRYWTTRRASAFRSIASPSCLLSGHERLDEVGHRRMLLGLRVAGPADEVLSAWLANYPRIRQGRVPGEN